MPYRKTRRSREQIARMNEGKARARMARPAPERAVDLPDLRRRLVVEDFDFGHIGWSRALAGLRKSLQRVGAGL